jgi:hypothetical protein
MSHWRCPKKKNANQANRRRRLKKSKNKIYANPLTWSQLGKSRKPYRNGCKNSRIRQRRPYRLTYRSSGRKIKR